eukprot:13959334-Ditylum_brightwellii.AAC.1
MPWMTYGLTLVTTRNGGYCLWTPETRLMNSIARPCYGMSGIYGQQDQGIPSIPTGIGRSLFFAAVRIYIAKKEYCRGIP